MKRYVFLDTETSGLCDFWDYICQLSYLVTDKDLNVIETKNFYFYVPEVGREAISVHGLTPDILKKLSGGKKFEDFADEIVEDLKNAELVICHNAEFDLGFVRYALEAVEKYRGKTQINNNYFCTMEAYTDILQIPHRYYKVKYPRLKEVIDYLNVTDDDIKKVIDNSFGESRGYHDSRYDVACTYIIYKKYLNLDIEKIQEENERKRKEEANRRVETPIYDEPPF